MEKLRLARPSEAPKAASEIFQLHVTPSAEKVVKLDTRMVRGMEAYVYGKMTSCLQTICFSIYRTKALSCQKIKN